MQCVVEAGATLSARREVIPAVRKPNAVAIQQVEVETDIRAEARKPFAKDHVVLQQGAAFIDIAGIVVHISIARPNRQTDHGQTQLAVCCEERVTAIMDEGEVVAQHALSIKVLECRKTRGGVHHRGDLLDIVVALQATACPEVQTVALAVVEAVEKLRAAVDVEGAAAVFQHIGEQVGVVLDVATPPFNGGPQAKVATHARITEGYGAVVVTVGDVATCRQVEPNRHLASLGENWCCR